MAEVLDQQQVNRKFRVGDLVRVTKPLRLNPGEKILENEEYIVAAVKDFGLVYLDLGYSLFSIKDIHLELVHRVDKDLKKEPLINRLVSCTSSVVLHLAVFTVYFSMITAYTMITLVYWPYSIAFIMLTISILYCYYRYWKHYKRSETNE